MLRKEIDILPEDRVKLRALFGIRPGYYLAALYALIILAVLFLLLFLPGLLKPGVVGVAASEPWGAAVRVDDVTLGTTPCEIFIPQGKREIEFVLPGFASEKIQIEAKGRIFASKFFPKKIKLTGTLKTASPAAVLAEGLREYAAWSFAGEPTESWQAPLALSEAAYRAGPWAQAGSLDGSLRAAAAFATTKAAQRDAIRALFLASSAGQSPSPFTLLAGISGAAEVALDVQKALGEADSGAAILGLSAQAGAENRQALAALSLNGQRFLPVPDGFLEKNGVRRNFDSFLIAETEVSIESWEAFAAENPKWSRDNREALIEEGLVSADYLLAVESDAYPRPSAPGVSWHAAKAYCEWLGGKLPGGFAAILPGEYEWEYAARYFEGKSAAPEKLSPGSAGGAGLWEWCGNGFLPLDADLEAGGQRYSPEVAVRGGSWVNQPGSVDIGTRASLPPDSCSPFVGFRPIIKRK